MEKKFKDDTFQVKGTETLLEALIKELTSVGYSFRQTSREKKYLTVYPDIHIIQFLESDFFNYPKYKLPQDWDKVLKLASEVEEIIPEYVECIVDVAKNDCGTPNIERGRIVQVIATTNNYTRFYTVSPGNADILSKNYPHKDDSSLSGTGYYYFKDFKSSTWEAYEAQSNAPKYKTGDFINYYGSLLYITEVKKEGDRTSFEYTVQIANGPVLNWNEKSNFYSDVTGNSTGNHTIYECSKIISDSEALEFLKKHYAKQGIVEGAKLQYAKCNVTAVRFDLVKNCSIRYRQYDVTSNIKQGNSQFAIYTGDYWVTPTTDGFKVLPKEVKVAGYEVEYTNGSEVKIGCQYYTKDSLITIRDLMTSIGFHTSIKFQLSHVGNVTVTVDELNAAIALFDK